MGGQERVTLLGRGVASLRYPPGGLLEGRSGISSALHGGWYAVVGVRDHDGGGDHHHSKSANRYNHSTPVFAPGWIGVIGGKV